MRGANEASETTLANETTETIDTTDTTETTATPKTTKRLERIETRETHAMSEANHTCGQTLNNARQHHKCKPQNIKRQSREQTL